MNTRKRMLMRSIKRLHLKEYIILPKVIETSKNRYKTFHVIANVPYNKVDIDIETDIFIKLKPQPVNVRLLV